VISIIVPVYNNEETIEELYERLIKAFAQLKQKYEIIFVDDASTDNSFEVLKSLHNQDNRIKIIKLIRNFGQSQATLAGFELSGGQSIVTIDADLQYNPEDIPIFLIKLEEGFHVVRGIRKNRCDSLFLKRIPSYFVNLCIKLKVKNNIRDIGCSFMALDNGIIEQLKNYGAWRRFYKVILPQIAGSLCEVEVAHFKRKSGRSQYGLMRSVALALDFILNFYFKPPFSGRNELGRERPLFAIEEILESQFGKPVK